jgi:hypothetical protein
MVRSFLTISIGRLRWTTGVLAGLVELPLIGILPRAGTALVAVGALTVPAAISPPVRAEAVPATAAVSTPSPAVGVVSPPTMPPSSASTPPQPDAPPPPDAPTTQVVPTAEDLVNQLLAPLGVQLPPLSPLVPTLLDEVGAGSPLRTGGSSP